MNTILRGAWFPLKPSKISIYCAYLTVRGCFPNGPLLSAKRKSTPPIANLWEHSSFIFFFPSFSSWTPVKMGGCSINKQAEVRAPLESNNERLGWGCWFTKVILTTTDKPHVTIGSRSALPASFPTVCPLTDRSGSSLYFRHYRGISRVRGTCGELRLTQSGQPQSGSIRSVREGVGVKLIQERIYSGRLGFCLPQYAQ